MTPVMNLTVQQSQVAYVLRDVAVLNPKDAEGKEGHIMIAIGEKRLVLPTCTDRRVATGRIGLTMEQRSSLKVMEGDKVEVQKEGEISSIGKVDLFVSFQFTTHSSRLFNSQIPEIRKAFQEKFRSHVLNKGHRVTLEVDGVMLSLHILNLYSTFGKEIRYGSLGPGNVIDLSMPKDLKPLTESEEFDLYVEVL